MSTENTQITVQPEKALRPSASFGSRGIVISNFDELTRFAVAVSKSNLAPKGFDSAESIFVAIQMGMEVGLSPMAALQNIAVVNGRPTIWGDAQLAVCRGTGELELFEEWFEIGGAKSTRNPTDYKDDTAAICRVKRKDGQEVESAFSVADAKRAGLWGKAGPWTQYPFRMLRNRARSFALRDVFGDALKGFRSTEEARDSTPEEIDVTPTAPKAEDSKLFKAAPPAPAPVETPKAEEPPALGDAAESVNALITETGITWDKACAVMSRNGFERFAKYATPEDATQEDLAQVVKFWPAIVKLEKKGGAK